MKKYFEVFNKRLGNREIVATQDTISVMHHPDYINISRMEILGYCVVYKSGVGNRYVYFRDGHIMYSGSSPDTVYYYGADMYTSPKGAKIAAANYVRNNDDLDGAYYVMPIFKGRILYLNIEPEGVYAVQKYN